MRDLEIMVGLLAAFTPQQRRETYVHMLMRSKGVTFREIARRAPGKPITHFMVSDAVKGRRPWSPRVVQALEATLGASLRPFLTAEEAARFKTHKA